MISIFVIILFTELSSIMLLISSIEIFEPTFNREVYTGTECEVIRGHILVSGVLSRLVEATGEIKVKIFPVKLQPTFNEVILDATFGELITHDDIMTPSYYSKFIFIYLSHEFILN